MAPEINISLDQSEGSLLSDDFLDTPDDLDINVDDIETPDETDSLEFLGNGNELEWEGEVGRLPSLPNPQIRPQCSSQLLGPSCQSPPPAPFPEVQGGQGFFCCFLGVFLAMLCSILVPRPGMELVPLRWKHGILTTGSPGKAWGRASNPRLPKQALGLHVHSLVDLWTLLGDLSFTQFT